MLALALAAAQAAPAAACRCDFAGVLALQKDPASAATAFIGSPVTGKDGARHVQVQLAWTRAPGTLPLDPSKCALHLEEGKRYVIASFNTAEFLEKRGLGLTICDSVAAELPKGGALLKKLAKRKPEFPTMADPGWFLCARDADCVASEDACGWPSAVTRGGRAAYEARNREMAPDLGCVAPPKLKAASRVWCDRGVCGLRNNDNGK